LNHNDFPRLPHKDIALSVRQIDVRGVPSLTKFPRPDIPTANVSRSQTFPQLEKLLVHYSIHCCWYKDYIVHAPYGGGGEPLDPDTSTSSFCNNLVFKANHPEACNETDSDEVVTPSVNWHNSLFTKVIRQGTRNIFLFAWPKLFLHSG